MKTLTDNECSDMINFINCRLTDSTVADPDDSCLVMITELVNQQV